MSSDSPTRNNSDYTVSDDLFHVVCHDCPEPQLIEESELVAAGAVFDHRHDTGHDVEYGPVQGGRAR